MSALKSAVRGEVNMRFDFSQLLFLPPAAAGAVSAVSGWENEKFRNPKHFHSHFAPVEDQCSVFCVASKGSTNFHGTQLLEKAPTSDFSSLRAFPFRFNI